MASKPEETGDIDRRYDASIEEVPLDAVPKGRWERSWPVIACGAGLFSDGYLNGVRFFFQAQACEGWSPLSFLAFEN